MQKPKLLVINTGSIKKKFVWQRLAKNQDIDLVVVHKERNWADKYVSDWIIADTTRHQQTLEAVMAYSQKNRISGVLTFWEDDVLITSKITDALGLIGIPHSVAQMVRNKRAFRDFCHAHGLPAPKHVKVTSASELESVGELLTFPVVIKPAFGSSSSYVVKAYTLDELKEVHRFIQHNLSAEVESALTDGQELVVEEYIDGDEVDVDILIQNGRIKFWSISDNQATQEPFFIESGQSIPTSLPEQSQEELVALADVTLEKLGITDGCIHFEAKYTKNGPVPIEVNLRMGGDEVYSFVKSAWHVDLIDGAVNIALGTHVPTLVKPEEPYEYLAGKYYLVEKSGVIGTLYLPKAFPKHLRVNEYHFFKEVGDVVIAPPASYDFLGWITVSGDNLNDARENLEAAYKQITYEVVPFSAISAVGKTTRKSRFQAAAIQSEQALHKQKIEHIRNLPKSDLRKLHIGIACNSYDSQDGSVEAELTAVGTTIQKTLAERGYRTTFLNFNNLEEVLGILRSGTLGLVFNVAERINGSSLLEPHAAALFDMYHVPYTGSNPLTLGLCIDKIKVKKILTYHGIPTSRWDYAYDLDDTISDELRYPLIVKPANTDNSIGITNDSVVVNKAQLDARVEYVLTQLKSPVLVEEYLEGDEYDVSILGSSSQDLRVLPLSRTNFTNLPEGYWHIYPFEKKFEEAPVYDKHLIVERPPKNVSKKLVSIISEIALDTYTILGCHDYGRVEVKLDAQDNPFVLELNPNPSINQTDCLPSVAALMGMDYGDFLEEIIALAALRYKNKPPYYHLQPMSF